MRKILIITLFLLPLLLFAQDKVKEKMLDINNATYEQIAQLPVPGHIAIQIHARIMYEGPFISIYELMDLPGFTAEMLKKLKPLIVIDPYEEKSDWEQRLDQLSYQMERWEGSEGINQVLVDYWYEQAINPILINEVRFDQLANLQGVSPVDAKAIMNYREQVGRIGSQRDLRSASYLSYYGYRNTRSFLSFDKPSEKKEFHGHLRVRMDDSPLMADEADADQEIPVDFVTNSNYPAFHSSFTGAYGKNIRVGFSQYHSYQEPYHYKDLGVVQIPDYKFYVGWENIKWHELEFRKIYAGYFSISFGKGVVMENNDYFAPRRSGYGFRKSFIGLSGDVSINRQYALRGLATEMSYKNLDAWFFASHNSRDAILNVKPYYINGQPETTVNQLIILDQRYEYAPSDYTRLDGNLSWLDAVNEVTYGTRFQYNFSPGNHIGSTIYESLYDKYLRPDYKEIVDPDSYGEIDRTDAEMFAGYGGTESDGESSLWGDAKSFRRIYGFDFQYVHKNLALQGEYAELDKMHDFSLLGDNPSAMVFNAYWQYNAFNFLALYRNYDLEFDNPYQRSFSNYRRFKKTIYEDYYYLQDPLYGQLYSNNPQPQAEKGYYISSRYQVNRYFIPTVELDNWTRKSDGASYYRYRFSADLRFAHPIRLNIRQKFQGREVNNEKTLLFYKTNEFRGRLRLMLSDYNELSLIYASSYTQFTPRPRFVFEPGTEGEATANLLRSGSAEAYGDALGATYRYRYGDWLKFRGQLLYYKGFFWNFEDTQFQVMDSKNGAFRSWVAVYTRLSSNFSIHTKLTWDHQVGVTDIQARNSDNEPLPDADSGTGKYYGANLSKENQFFYLIEFNYHF